MLWNRFATYMHTDCLLNQGAIDIISLWEGLASNLFCVGWFSRSWERG